MNKPRIGLLPLYLELYDRIRKQARGRVEAFYRRAAEALEERGLEVLRVPVARTRGEFRLAMHRFESGGANAVVTLHLAYSPSLESADALSSSPLPLIILDTTPAPSFGPDTDPEEIMYNHGIHGVQDLCNLLTRSGKHFQIEAGHLESSDVLDRVISHVRAASMASRMRRAKVGLIGRPFRGMGDFSVPAASLRRHPGLRTVGLSSGRLKSLLASVSDEDLEALEADLGNLYRRGEVSGEALRRSLRLALALERWIEKERLTAWSFNFLCITKRRGFSTVPFLAASRLMARGIGYAGEGDVLTAALVGALAFVFPATGFTEMFCPDWKNGTLFLSHMGEMNPALVEGQAALHEMGYEFSDTADPAVLTGRFRAGKVLLVDLAPLSPTDFRIITASAAMVAPPGEDRMKGVVRGWLRPDAPLEEFLAQYSRLGGTHHLAVSYDADLRTVQSFAAMMGWETRHLGKSRTD